MFKINKRSLLFLLGVFIILAPRVNARSASIINVTSPKDVINAFRQYKEIKNLDILVPTVVEVPIEDFYLERTDFAIVDQSTNLLVPSYYKNNTVINNSYYTAKAIPSSSTDYKMTDKNSKTYREFELGNKDQASVIINIKSNVLISSSAIIALLDTNVALPTSVEVLAVVNGQNKKLLAKSKMFNQTIRFPKTSSKDWKITFEYAQPLRINELKLVQENPNKSNSQSVRFLAQVNRDYRIYFNPDRYISINAGEAGNLYSNEDVLVLGSIFSKNNPFYTQADIDNDGIPNILDNCVSIANEDQKDINNNNRGDVCEDFDKDGIMNDKDNCPNNPNKYQRDIDRDGIGDICDTEESRITEKHKWIPWLGIVFALIVIVVLFVITAKSKELPDEQEDMLDE